MHLEGFEELYKKGYMEESRISNRLGEQGRTRPRVEGGEISTGAPEGTPRVVYDGIDVVFIGRIV